MIEIWPSKVPFADALRNVLSLPKGSKIIRNGILQTGDFPEVAVDALKSMDRPIKPLPKAINYGPPSDQEVTEALRAIYDADSRGIPYGNEHYTSKDGWKFFLDKQGNLFPIAKATGLFDKNGPAYCYDTLMS